MTPSPTRSTEVPGPFQHALDTLRRAVEGDPARPELELEDMPAPQRLAPYTAAISASVYRDDAAQPTGPEGRPVPVGQGEPVEIATGRLIVLYDPEGRSGWAGGFRIVAYIRADLEPEIAADPLIGTVAWSWLVESLEVAGYAGVSGTVTRAVSESFGDKQDEPSTTELEMRASWSPTGEDLTGHVAAWCEVMCKAGGLPPAGVTSLSGSGQ